MGSLYFVMVCREDVLVSSERVEEASEVFKSSGYGLFLFDNPSVSSGSMVLRVRSCQPF